MFITRENPSMNIGSFFFSLHLSHLSMYRYIDIYINSRVCVCGQTGDRFIRFIVHFTKKKGFLSLLKTTYHTHALTDIKHDQTTAKRERDQMKKHTNHNERLSGVSRKKSK